MIKSYCDLCKAEIKDARVPIIVGEIRADACAGCAHKLIRHIHSAPYEPLKAPIKARGKENI